MADLTSGKNGNDPQKPASDFSFQENINSNSAGAVPTAPFETISYQTPSSDPSALKKEGEEKVISAANINIGQADLSILKEKEEKGVVQKPKEESFLERYKISKEDIKKNTPKIEDQFKPSASPPPQPQVPVVEKKKAEARSTAGHNDSNFQMPSLPKQSFLGKLLPLGLFFLVIALAIFLGMKFLPGLKGTKQVSLTWWGLWEDEKTIAPVILAYKKIKPNVTITYIKKNPKDYRTLLQTQIARDSGPDIFRFHNTWLPMLSVELKPMPEKMKTEINFSNVFYPTAYYDLVRSNQIYGLPLMFDGLALFYNRDILSGAGLQPPETWTETADAARKLTVFDENKNLKVSGLALGNTNVDHWSDILGLMFLQNGADPAFPTDSCAKEALEYFGSFSQGESRTWDDTLGGSTLAFANSRAAMYIAPSWEVFEIKKINPNLNFGISPFPQVAGGKRYWATYWAEGVSSKSKNPEEAWEFLKYLGSKEALQIMFAEATKESKERLFGEIYPRQDMASLIKDDPLVGPFIVGAPQAKSWYLASRTFDDGINDRIIKYYEDTVNKVVRKEQSTEEALKTVSEGVSQVLKDYGISPPSSNPNCQPE